MRFFFLAFCFLFSLFSLVTGSAAELNAKSAERYYEQAVEFMKQEKYDAAIEYFQKALQEAQGPEVHARIYNLVGLAYMRQGVSVVSAIGSFEQSIKLDPTFAEAYFNIASVYAGSDLDPPKAAEYFKKTIEVDPKYYKAYFGLGWFSLMRNENPGEAMEYFKITLENFPDFAEAHYGMGLAHIRSHQPFMALGSVSRLRELKRDDLASVLEKAMAEISPPQDNPAPAKSVFSAGETASEPAPAPPAPTGKSPFEVIVRGKLVPVADDK